MPKSILVADVAEMRPRLSVILSRLEVTFVGTLDEAVKAMHRRMFDLIVIGVHFDESRMFDLLRHVRLDEKNRAKPVVCVRGHLLESTAISLEGLDIAIKALSGNVFVDFARFGTDAEGDAAIRRIIDRTLDINGEMNPGQD
jgi:CheY-like chemotaxis protein